jgi:BirA family biotin operon repressor/biotin-[acetyl-CoA-carboxylase] ligase
LGLGKPLGLEFHIERFDEVSSTNDVARRLAEQGHGEGTVVVADTQTVGRGRRGRPWYSPQGGIWLSLILKPSMDPRSLPVIGLLASVVVAEAVEEMSGLRAGLKWPNDILLNGRKAGGVLSEVDLDEMSVGQIILGVGFNLNVDLDKLPDEIRGTSTSLREEIGRWTSEEEFVSLFLRKFDVKYSQIGKEGSSKVLNRWRELSTSLGSRVAIRTVTETFMGTALDIDEDGALIVEKDQGERRKFLSGDVAALRDWKI